MPGRPQDESPFQEQPGERGLNPSGIWMKDFGAEETGSANAPRPLLPTEVNLRVQSGSPDWACDHALPQARAHFI